MRTATWEEYWDGCDCAAEEIERLHVAWNAFITGGHSVEQRQPFRTRIFRFAAHMLDGYSRGEIDLSVLRKVVGFETFSVSCEQGHLAAGIFNIRNPAYLLSRVARPKAPEDPKFLPLICPHDQFDGERPAILPLQADWNISRSSGTAIRVPASGRPLPFIQLLAYR